MSSTHRTHHSIAQPQKRKTDRACDACRKKKARCDGPKMPNNHCSNCLQSGKTCTYIESSKPRGPPKAYIIGLENKMEKMEALLCKLRPDTNFSDEIGPPVIRDSWRNDGRVKSETPSTDIAMTVRPTPSYHDLRSTDDYKSPLHLLPEPRLSSARHVDQKHHRYRSETAPESDSSASTDGSLLSSSDSELRGQSPATVLTLRGTEECVHFADDPQSIRFHGRSSVFGLVDASVKYRQNLLKESGNMNGNTQPRSPSDDSIRHTRRAEFWRLSKWELAWEGYEHFDTKGFLYHIFNLFPPPKLARNLIDLYFEHINTFFPLLHRPTFERQYFEDRLHTQDIWFAGVCHALFALASRWSNDPEVVPRNARTQNGDIDWSKAGWDNFNMVIDIHRARRSLLLPATLFEMQTILLLTLFLRYSSLYPASWVIIGIGFRKAQDVGAHRKKMYREKPTVDCELWRRCFWLLVLYDILSATTLGRPGCVSQEDYDLDLPLEVDDEYWETDDPADAFKQPEGVPSKVTMFIYAIKIGWILVFTLKTLYATNKSASFVPKTRSRKEQLLKQIETAIDEWLKSLPVHLRWSETAAESLFGGQSALISLYYYVTQLVAYRPFITLPSVDHTGQANRDDGSSYSIATKAMSISTSAARAIVRMMKAQASYKIKHMAGIFHASHYAAGQLLLRLWYLKAQGKAQKEMKDGSGSNKTVQMTSEEISLTQEIDELVADLRTMISIYEEVQTRWEFVRPILERLKECVPKDGEIPHPEVWYQPVQQRPNHVQVSQPQYTIPLLPRDTAEFVCFSQPHDQQTFPFYSPSKTFSADYTYASPLPETLRYGSEAMLSIPVAQPESSTQPAPVYSPVEFQKSWLAHTSPVTPFDAESYFIPNQHQNIGDYGRGMAAQSSGAYGTATEIASVVFNHLYPGEGQEVSLDCPLCGGKPSQCSLAACTTNDLQGSAIPNPEGIFGTTSAYMYGSSVTADQSYSRPDIPPADISATLPRFLDRLDSDWQPAVSHMSSQDWPIDDPSPFVDMSQ